MVSLPTAVTLLLAILAGLWLYQVKHRAVVLDQQIARTLGQVAAARERIGLQRAEWALLDEPHRLDVLASQHLGLRPLATSQYVSLADLRSHLPTELEPGAPSWPIAAHVRGLGTTRDGHATSRGRLPGMARPLRLHEARVRAAGNVRARVPDGLTATRLAGAM